MGHPPPLDGPEVPPLPVLVAQSQALLAIESAQSPAALAAELSQLQAKLDLNFPGFSVTPPNISLTMPQVDLGIDASVHLAASFSLATPSFEFCGFGLPSFSFNLAFVFDFDFSVLFAFPPAFFFVLELPCGFAIPIGVGPGGGRVGAPVPEFGAEFE